MRHRFLGALLTAALFCLSTPAIASDRWVLFPQMTVTSTGINQQARDQRIALGTWLLHALNLAGSGVGSGTYANISASPSTGLYVTMGPSVGSTLGALYQVQQDDTALPAGCPGTVTACSQLAADPTLIVVPAYQATSSSTLGPLSAPGTLGQSVYYLIEAAVTPSVDTNSSNQQFLIGQGQEPVYVPQSYAVNITRTDQISYHVKAGTAGTSPTQPSTDSGYIAITNCLIPYGTTQVTSGMCTAATAFAGFAQGGSTVTSVSPSPPITASISSGVAHIGLTVPLAQVYGGTATSAPSPQVTSTACAASPALSGSWPSQTLLVPAGCATPIAVPVSIPNGGTATSAPSPQVTATACNASPAFSGAWPSQTLSIPAGCTNGFPTTTTNDFSVCAAQGTNFVPCYGLVPPTVTIAGSPAPTTAHCATGSVTASVGSSATITLTNNAVFASFPTEIDVIDSSLGTQLSPTSFSSIGPTGFSFTSTSGHLYYYRVCGF